MRHIYLTARTRLGLALGASVASSLLLFAAGAWWNGSMAFSYIIWNLFLAWLPLVFALWLERVLQYKLWSSWFALFVTLLWLLFLPNSFYLITDYVHLQDLPRADLLYDIVMFTSFIFNGVIMGYFSLYLVHSELAKRLAAQTAWMCIGMVLLLCSFAIYIGRNLRWNTWDIIANPASLLFDVSDRVINAREHPQAFVTTASFFILLTSLYAVFWYAARSARMQNKREANNDVTMV